MHEKNGDCTRLIISMIQNCKWAKNKAGYDVN